jgi:glycosyltransferase involved in cell wall biosynthesis
MKVAIFDLVHLDWIIPYSELLYNEPIDVYFYVSADFQQDIETSDYYKGARFHWHFVEPVQGGPAFLKSLYLFISVVAPDLIILNSVDGKHFFIYLVLVLNRIKGVVINIHSINNNLNPSFYVSLKTTIRTVSKKILNAKAEGYIVNAEAMRAFIVKRKLTVKPVYVLSPVYYKEVPTDQTTPVQVVITIPGAIDIRRRDYHLALNAFSGIITSTKYLKVVFAGRPVGSYGREVLDSAKELAKGGADIQFYEEEVPEKEFQDIVASSTLILSPLVYTTVIHDQTEERYGLTKTSGNVYDAIRYGKPLIIPDYVTVPEEIKSSCIVYSSLEDLSSKVGELIHNPELLNQYKLQARINSSAFSKEKAIENLLKIIYHKKQ